MNHPTLIPIMIIDDELHVRRSLTQMLELESYQVRSFSSARQALADLSPEWQGAVICDINLPEMSGLEFLRKSLEIDPDLPVVLLTGYGNVSIAVDAMHIGAYDFLEKPFCDRLLGVLSRACEKRKLVLENRGLRRDLDLQDSPSPQILGHSPEIKRLRRILAQIKDTAASVLICGETGTGKELVARFLHDRSYRCDKPFVPINCGAIPEHIMEGELFGYEQGAFTGATKRRIGKISHANGGTLFFDEIDSMPEFLQVKLLRVLEDRKVEPLGCNKTLEVDIRVLAATKRDLKALSEQGKFRADLYYRLNVVGVTIPPLRERKKDIPLLFEHFVHAAVNRYQKESPILGSEQLMRMQQYDWPGNLRELRNFAERFVLINEEGEPLSMNASDRAHADSTLAEQISCFEHALLQDALDRHSGRLKDVQEDLGLSRRTLYEKMKKHGLNKFHYRKS